MIHVQNGNWFTDKGDETVALDWPIGPESLVWEIGGFSGRWAGQMVEKYDCRMEIFEPQEWASDQLCSRFGDNQKVMVHSWGLWVMDEIRYLNNFGTDGATIMTHSMNFEKPKQLVTLTDIFNWGKNIAVDVCLMNIEGAEFSLIPYMIGCDIMNNFNFFWCQFHPGFVDNGDEKANMIYKGMMRTHHKIWDYYPTAVAWERKA